MVLTEAVGGEQVVILLLMVVLEHKIHIVVGVLEQMAVIQPLRLEIKVEGGVVLVV